MRWTAVAALMTLASGTGCVDGDGFEPQYHAPQHVAYRRPTSMHTPSRARSSRSAKIASARPRPAHPIEQSYPSAWYPYRGRISPRWTSIVIHHSATTRGGAGTFDKYHREKNGWDELGYHFVIGNGTETADGMIEVGPRWYKQKHGAHCKTPGNYYNEHGIGICLVGNFDKTSPTPRQLRSLTELLRFLQSQCNIGPGQITAHGLVTGKTVCPGRRFPLTAIRRAVSAPISAHTLH